MRLSLQDTQTIIEFALIIKAKDSSNIFDAWVGYNGRKYDRKELLRLNNIICDAYKNKLELKSGEYPIVFLEGDFTYKIKLLKDLNGLLWGSGGHIFPISSQVKKIFMIILRCISPEMPKMEILCLFLMLKGFPILVIDFH